MAVRESHEEGHKVRNELSLIDVERRQVILGDFIVTADARHPLPDFVDSPRFSPDGKHVVGRAWCVSQRPLPL